jgi:hypothetical protein
MWAWTIKPAGWCGSSYINNHEFTSGGLVNPKPENLIDKSSPLANSFPIMISIESIHASICEEINEGVSTLSIRSSPNVLAAEPFI